jgi:hypothetical protein
MRESSVDELEDKNKAEDKASNKVSPAPAKDSIPVRK